MAELTHEGLSVAIRERADADQAEIGVVVEGAFVPFGQVKLGDYREAIERAADEKAASDQQAAEAKAESERQAAEAKAAPEASASSAQARPPSG